MASGLANFSADGLNSLETKPRRQSKSDSDTSSFGDLSGSSQDSLGWCSSVGPLNWADEVEAELDSGDEYLVPSNPPSPNVGAAVVAKQATMKATSSEIKQRKPKKDNHQSLVKGADSKPVYQWTDGCAGAVLQLLQEHGVSRTSINLGWEALRRIWNVGPMNLDNAVLSCLGNKPPRSQEHILLSFAAIDLSNVKNLSAYLNCLVKEHDTTRQVCLYFLAGLCTEGKSCTWVHPVNTKGWDALRDTWQITYRDLDYTVLNFLCKKTIEEQDNILISLANMDLRGIHNLSAYLSSMIQKHGGFNQSSSARRRDLKRDRANGRHGQRGLPEMAEQPAPYYSPQYFPQPPMVPSYGAPYMPVPYQGWS